MLDSKRLELLEELAKEKLPASYKLAAQVAKTYETDSEHDTNKTRAKAHKIAAALAHKHGYPKLGDWHAKQHVASMEKAGETKLKKYRQDPEWEKEYKAKSAEKSDAEAEKNREAMAQRAANIVRELKRKKTPEEVAAKAKADAEAAAASAAKLREKFAKMQD